MRRPGLTAGAFFRLGAPAFPRQAQPYVTGVTSQRRL